jgi:hypothetical protein
MRYGPLSVRASDDRLALLISGALFVLAAWPLALVDLPPLQDLPNHLAAITVIQHPDLYPDLAFTGLFKTNAALFAWLLLVGKLTGTRAAAKLFVLGVLALGAFAYPRFVLSFGGRRRMLVSALFVWPMVHDWFVSSGMLDFALAVPMAVLTLVLLNAQRLRPSAGRGAAIALLAAATWYAHVFPVLAVGLLVAVHVATRRTWRERADQALALLAPLLPAGALVASSLWVHFTEPVGAMTANVALGRWAPPWELVYNLWAEWTWAFTKLEITTIVPTILLAACLALRWRDDVPFFGPVAVAALLGLYLFFPYVATNWFHVNSRFIPFIWLAALVRLPEQLPRRVPALLGACAIAASVGMGVDYVRLSRDWGRFTAGIGAVPEGRTCCRSSSAARARARTPAPCCTPGASTSPRSTRARRCSSRTRAASPSCTAIRRRPGSTTWCSRRSPRRWARPSPCAACCGRQASPSTTARASGARDGPSSGATPQPATTTCSSGTRRRRRWPSFPPATASSSGRRS